MPLNTAEKRYLQQWLEVADLDLQAAQRMLADSPTAYGYHIPFAFQQAVEKYCKGALLAQQLSFPRTHDLSDLLDKLASTFVFTTDERDDADCLADYAVSTRYPPGTRVTVSEMQEAARIALNFQKRLRPFIEAALV
jgi:HEPN domain-containing protein